MNTFTSMDGTSFVLQFEASFWGSIQLCCVHDMQVYAVVVKINRI